MVGTFASGVVEYGDSSQARNHLFKKLQALTENIGTSERAQTCHICLRVPGRLYKSGLYRIWYIPNEDDRNIFGCRLRNTRCCAAVGNNNVRSLFHVALNNSAEFVVGSNIQHIQQKI